MKKIIVFLVFTVFGFYSCNIDTCSEKLPFKLDYHLFSHIEVNGDTYCEMVNKAFNNDDEIILVLSKMELYDFAAYQHGAVLIEIIDCYSEQKYCDLISRLSELEKKHIYYTVRGGLEFTPNNKFQNKDIQDVFPLLYKIVNNR